MISYLKSIFQAWAAPALRLFQAISRRVLRFGGVVDILSSVWLVATILVGGVLLLNAWMHSELWMVHGSSSSAEVKNFNQKSRQSGYWGRSTAKGVCASKALSLPAWQLESSRVDPKVIRIEKTLQFLGENERPDARPGEFAVTNTQTRRIQVLELGRPYLVLLQEDVASRKQQSGVYRYGLDHHSNSMQQGSYGWDDEGLKAVEPAARKVAVEEVSRSFDSASSPSIRSEGVATFAGAKFGGEVNISQRSHLLPKVQASARDRSLSFPAKLDSSVTLSHAKSLSSSLHEVSHFSGRPPFLQKQVRDLSQESSLTLVTLNNHQVIQEHIDRGDLVITFEKSGEGIALRSLGSEESLYPLRKSSTPLEDGVGPLLNHRQVIWHGQDLFLYYHGGRQHRDLGQMQRLQFKDHKEGYTHYIGLNMGMICQDGRWIPSTYLLDSTEFYPLLWLEKIEENALRFRFWPIGGYYSREILVEKSHEHWSVERLVSSLALQAVKSKSEVILSIEGHRCKVHKNDWILHREGQWKRIHTIPMIDQYVSGELSGDLLVIQDIDNSEGRWKVQARIYSPSRTLVKDVTIGYTDEDPQNSQLRGVHPQKLPMSDAGAPLPRSNLPLESEKMPSRGDSSIQPMEEIDDDSFYWSDEEMEGEPPMLSAEELLEMLKAGSIEKILTES